MYVQTLKRIIYKEPLWKPCFSYSPPRSRALAQALPGERAIAAAAILMWGEGDAAAALTGIYFGTHIVR